MKNILTLFLVLIVFSLDATAQVPSYVSKIGLQGWWGFNENPNDESGNGNHGIVNGPILASDRFGKNLSAYKFNGNTDLIATTKNGVIGNTFTVSFWVQLDSIRQNWLIVQGGNQTGYSSAFDKGAQFLANGIIVQYIFTGKGNWIGNDTLLAGPNRWYHIVYGLSSSGTKLYINSKLVATNTDVTTSQNMSGYWRFGGCTHLGQTSLFGKLDDIGVWNRLLSQSEVTDLYVSQCSLNILKQPNPSSSIVGGTVRFSVKTNDSLARIQWHTKVAGIDWMPLSDNNSYSNVNFDSLVVSNIELGNHNQLFRAIISNDICKDTTETVTLSVLDTCISKKIDTVRLVITDTIKKIISDTVKIAVSDTLIIKIKSTGFQENKYNTFLIYPNPTNTFVIIDCANINEVGNYTYTITNSLGQEKLTSKFTSRYQQIDISGIGGAGLYIISIRDKNNNVIETRKLLIQ
ncbi:MAG: LamG-like jellyroll fold domain-containing protein [Bacteroidota bacterium]